MSEPVSEGFGVLYINFDIIDFDCFFISFLQSLVSMVNGFQDKLTGLEEQASKLEQIGSDSSKATISRSMTTVWQRWTRLRSIARGQERVLEDTAQEWRTFREKVFSFSFSTYLPCP